MKRGREELGTVDRPFHVSYSSQWQGGRFRGDPAVELGPAIPKNDMELGSFVERALQIEKPISGAIGNQLAWWMNLDLVDRPCFPILPAESTFGKSSMFVGFSGHIWGEIELFSSPAMRISFQPWVVSQPFCILQGDIGAGLYGPGKTLGVLSTGKQSINHYIEFSKAGEMGYIAGEVDSTNLGMLETGNAQGTTSFVGWQHWGWLADGTPSPGLVGLVPQKMPAYREETPERLGFDPPMYNAPITHAGNQNFNSQHMSDIPGTAINSLAAWGTANPGVDPPYELPSILSGPSCDCQAIFASEGFTPLGTHPRFSQLTINESLLTPGCWPYQIDIQLAFFCGAAVTGTLHVSNGITLKLAACGNRMTRSFGVHSYAETSGTPGTESGSKVGLTLSALTARSTNDILAANHIDFYAENSAFVLGHLDKLCGSTTIQAGAGTATKQSFYMPIAPNCAGLICLRRPFAPGASLDRIIRGPNRGIGPIDGTQAPLNFPSNGELGDIFTDENGSVGSTSMYQCGLGAYWSSQGEIRNSFQGLNAQSVSGGDSAVPAGFSWVSCPLGYVGRNNTAAEVPQGRCYPDATYPLIGGSLNGVPYGGMLQNPTYSFKATNQYIAQVGGGTSGANLKQVPTDPLSGNPSTLAIGGACQGFSVAYATRQIRAPNSINQCLMAGMPQVEISYISGAPPNPVLELDANVFYQMLVGQQSRWGMTGARNALATNVALESTFRKLTPSVGIGETRAAAIRSEVKRSTAIQQADGDSFLARNLPRFRVALDTARDLFGAGKELITRVDRDQLNKGLNISKQMLRGLGANAAANWIENTGQPGADRFLAFAQGQGN